MSSFKYIKENYDQVREEISRAAQGVSRKPSDIKLVVVTKTESIEVIEELFSMGVRDFGENRVEESINKIKYFSNKSSVKWHMIGHVQSRKAEQISEYFDYLHSLDNLKLAKRLNRFATERNKIMPVLLQINVSGEQSKSGLLAADEKKWDDLMPDFESLLSLPNLKIQGLMTMAPYGIDPEETRPVFVRLRKFRDHSKNKFPGISWKELSMGMSSDFQIAVQEGASILRIGSKVFET